MKIISFHNAAILHSDDDPIVLFGYSKDCKNQVIAIWATNTFRLENKI